MKILSVLLALIFLAAPALGDEGGLADLVSGMDFTLPTEEITSEYYTETEAEDGLLHQILVEYGEDGGYVRAVWMTREGVLLRDTATVEIRTGHDGRDPAGQDVADAVTLAMAETNAVWTARYGEIWVIVGAIPASSASGRETLASGVDVPESYYMIAVAQSEDGVRALSVMLPQATDRWAFPVHGIVTIDELEKLSGLEFFPEMPSFLKRPLQADRPTRLWPICFRDILKLVLLRFT